MLVFCLLFKLFNFFFSLYDCVIFCFSFEMKKKGKKVVSFLVM